MGPLLSGSHAALLASPRVKLILIEEDGDVDYTRWGAKLAAAGFTRVWRTTDTTPWNPGGGYSAWRRGGLGPLPSCQAYARAKGLSPKRLRCLEP